MPVVRPSVARLPVVRLLAARHPAWSAAARPIAARLTVAAVVVAALSSCSASGSAPAAGARTSASPAAAPALPVAARALPASAAPTLAPVPAPGTVRVQPGPFDDRFSLTGTSLRSGTLRTELTITSDVSELIVLETQADFYDAAGHLLGSVRVDHEDPHDDGQVRSSAETVPMVMTAPRAWLSRVRSAVLSVPTLVNE